MVIVDLEDAVAAGHRNAALEALGKALDQGLRVAVRVHALGTKESEVDLEMLSSRLSSLDAIMIAKAENASALAALAKRFGLDAPPLVALIETARGVLRAEELAATFGVERLAFGALDYEADTGASGSEGLAFARSMLVAASRSSRIARPLDSPSVAIHSDHELAGEAIAARRMGFGGKLCIHPLQVAFVNQSFRPTESELANARAIVMAAEGAGGAAVKVDGQMVDRPIVEAARKLLAMER